MIKSNYELGVMLMSKVAMYLQEHIFGDVSSQPRDIKRVARDASVLEKAPEMVVFPRLTSDIRKIATFCWQLATKGHVLAITARGGGHDETGAAVGRGVIVETTRYMNKIFEYESKQKLVRLQPGVTVGAFRGALGLYGVGIPLLADELPTATIGGSVAAGLRGAWGGKYGRMSEWVDQLEVVLANGDVIQTGRISKRELSRRKGLQSLEGELYRAVDNLIEDNSELLKSLAEQADSASAGYPNLAAVKQRDGSFDLTPLFVGSQGTLGIISEMILKVDFMSFHLDVVVISFASKETARDASAAIAKLEPAFADYFDAELFVRAANYGRKYPWFDKASFGSGAVVVVGFDDFNDRSRRKKVKKLVKMFDGVSARVETASGEEAEGLLATRQVASSAYQSASSDQAWPPLVDDFYVPEQRFEEFTGALQTLAAKHRVELLLSGHILTNRYSVRPMLHLRRVGDKQKVFKLIDELANIVEHHDGALIGDRGEGRLKAKSALKHLTQDERDMYAALKTAFDPHGILNPGVKEDSDLRDLAAMLRSDY